MSFLQIARPKNEEADTAPRDRIRVSGQPLTRPGDLSIPIPYDRFGLSTRKPSGDLILINYVAADHPYPVLARRNIHK
jgi:hypothetical protein